MTATYPGSNIRGYTFSKDNGATWTAEQTGTSYTFTGLTHNTTYTLKMRAYDNRGNYVQTGAISRATVTLTAGSLTMKKGSASGAVYNSNTWANQNIYVARNNGNAGTTSYESISGSAQTVAVGTTAATSISTQGTTTLRVKTTDGTNTVYSGNYIIKLDKTAPTAGTLTMKKGSASGAAYSNGSWTNQSVYLAAVNGTDTLSKHKSTVFKCNRSNNIK